MSTTERLHALDAVRAFALLLGVVFHAGFSFLPGMIPGLWAMADNSPSTAIAVLLFTAHIFRMTLFFFIAGFFARLVVTRRGARGFWADRGKRIALPLVVGWLVLFPATAAVWIWGLSITFAGAPPSPPPTLPPPPPAAFPLTHLWFLYYLLVLYALVFAARSVVHRLDRAGAARRAADVVVRSLVRRGLAAFVLGLPLAAAMYARPNWIAWFGIPTPDRSLLPEAASVIGYGTAIGFGWLVHRQPDVLQAWGRQWAGHLGLALGATIVCLALIGTAPSFAAPAQRGVYALAYCVAIWSWTFAVIGVAVRGRSQAHPRIRYVADSSYWIYLVHLPVVAALQVMVGRLPWHWSVKFPLVLAVSFLMLFTSYHLLVRFTFIGQVLNGRRFTRVSETSLHAGDPPPEPGRDHEALADLTAVHKRYDKTAALSGLDLRVGPGELVAVLGPNGAGKSTAISVLLGLREADAGTVRLMGGSPADVESRRGVGVMMQEAGLPPTLRVREQIALTCSYYPAPYAVDDVLDLTGTRHLADRQYGTLSAGQKRLCQFALAVCGRPQLLFLDEPTVGLDIQAREAMWRVMRQLVAAGASIVLTTHYLEEAEALADRVVVLAHGRVVAAGTVQEIRSVVVRKRIACRTTLLADVVQEWEEVVSAVRENQRLMITALDAEAVVRRLLTLDPALDDLEVRQAGLGEAFTHLTAEAA